MELPDDREKILGRARARIGELGLSADQEGRIMAVIQQNWTSARFQNLIADDSHKSLSDYILSVDLNLRLYAARVEALFTEQDPQAWADLFNSLCKWANSYLIRKNFYPDASTWERAEGIATETVIALQTAVYPFDVDLDAWLHVVLKNTARNHLRHNNHRGRLLDEARDIDDLDLPQAGQAVEQQILNNTVLLDAIEALNPSRREVIVLRYIKGLSYEEIAERMQRSVGAVHNLHFQAIADMRTFFEEGDR
jgi:RNA polymerase sigma factor (sigma-70 family)